MGAEITRGARAQSFVMQLGADLLVSDVDGVLYSRLCCWSPAHLKLGSVSLSAMKLLFVWTLQNTGL